jgi:pyridoxamine 5'-phosphate oxidase
MPPHVIAARSPMDNGAVAGPPSHLTPEDLDPDPVRQFTTWFGQARDARVAAPEAAAVATASAGAAPSVRMVLVKRADADGFVFYTNYESRKGRDLAENPVAALLFYWVPLGRQVRVEGHVARTGRDETIRYAHSRARASQLSALASPQSRVVEHRELLEARVAELDARHRDAQLPVSEGWGGFRLTPQAYEFWQQGPSRLHDRLRYTPNEGGGWLIERLAP